MTTRECQECGKTYTTANYRECPFCGSTFWKLVIEDEAEIEPANQQSKRTSSSKNVVSSDSRKSLEDLVASQNELLAEQARISTKNTHATRAAVVILRFFMANLFIFGVWFILGFPKEIFWVIVLCLTWLTGAIMTLISADKEYRKSE